MFYGRGAGSRPTASAVIADIIDTSLGTYAERFNNLCYFNTRESCPIVPFSETVSRFYVRFSVKDIPGVLAKITAILAENNISVASLIQKESTAGETGIEMMTHECRELDFRRAIETTERLDFVIGQPAFIRAINMEFR